MIDKETRDEIAIMIAEALEDLAKGLAGIRGVYDGDTIAWIVKQAAEATARRIRNGDLLR
jgi:hypothetical protein